jgi:heme-degrading monooxygenase HmoA
MIAVIFEFTPAQGRFPDYMALVGQLKPELDKAEGFISLERFESITTPGKFVSLQFWRDEESVAKWRNVQKHREAQKKGRGGILRLVPAAHRRRDPRLHDGRARSGACRQRRRAWLTHRCVPDHSRAHVSPEGGPVALRGRILRRRRQAHQGRRRGAHPPLPGSLGLRRACYARPPARRASTAPVYEIQPMAPGNFATPWTSKSAAFGTLSGRFIVVGDAILSAYESATGALPRPGHDPAARRAPLQRPRHAARRRQDPLGLERRAEACLTERVASFEEHLAREIILSERVRMAILAGLLGALLVFYGLAYALFARTTCFVSSRLPRSSTSSRSSPCCFVTSLPSGT